jgi:hypothetical protein
LAIALTLSPLRAITRISTACSWVNINSQKAVILAQVGHFYFGAVGQYYFGANICGVALLAHGHAMGCAPHLASHPEKSAA